MISSRAWLRLAKDLAQVEDIANWLSHWANHGVKLALAYADEAEAQEDREAAEHPPATVRPIRSAPATGPSDPA